MAHNIEVKARCRNLDQLTAKVEALADGPGVKLAQRDVFFNVDGGRLKLRVESMDGATPQGTLIAYHRDNCPGPKRSQYELVAVPDYDQLEKALGLVPGVRIIVEKTRMLYMVGQTRVHLDRVNGLGDFLELEVVLRGDQSEVEGERIADGLIRQLNLETTDFVACAYANLLLDQSSE